MRVITLKKNGGQTQRRSELFDEQTAFGEYKFNLFIKAISYAGIKLSKVFEVACSNISIKNEIDLNDNGSKFILTFDYDKNIISAKWISYKMKHKSPEFPIHILDALFVKFNGYNHGKIGERIKSINGFTELRKDSNIICACPNYRNDKNWFDWVTVNWEDYGLLEAQCLLFLDFSTIIMESYDINTSQVEGIDKEHTTLTVGKAALVHSIIQEGSPTYERKALKKVSLKI